MSKKEFDSEVVKIITDILAGIDEIFLEKVVSPNNTDWIKGIIDDDEKIFCAVCNDQSGLIPNKLFDDDCVIPSSGPSETYACRALYGQLWDELQDVYKNGHWDRYRELWLSKDWPSIKRKHREAVMQQQAVKIGLTEEEYNKTLTRCLAKYIPEEFLFDKELYETVMDDRHFSIKIDKDVFNNTIQSLRSLRSTPLSVTSVPTKIAMNWFSEGYYWLANNDLAKKCGCAPVTVRAAKHKLGLNDSAHS